MKYLLHITWMLAVLSCNTGKNTPENIAVLQTNPVLSKEDSLIKAAIIAIENKNLETAGETKLSLEVDGMEVIRISMKVFLVDEKKSQEENFANYMKYLDRFANSKNPLNNPEARIESQAKHNAVIKYLDQLIKSTPATDKVYKVVYHLNVATQANTYNQLKTTYLGKDFTKISVSYLHLKPIY